MKPWIRVWVHGSSHGDDWSAMTPRHQKFIHAIVAGKSTTEAARVAGYSERSAHVTGSRLLNNAKIQAEIANFLQKAGIKSEKILKADEEIAFSDAREFFDDNGQLKLPVDWTDSMGRRVRSYEVTDTPHGPKIKLTFWDKGSSIERLGTHLGLYKHNLALEVEGELIIKWQGS